ncbi:unnamed protein product [Strongylus vulgaris]|uniref:Arrestin-like N-terminal domain-containing protein n=1 Tax=Strongylus vulgaris TaxID=40348 RepID=A0A3P7JBH1_STRVU|nr:unnamed protein product [Strongylus vulgaris]
MTYVTEDIRVNIRMTVIEFLLFSRTSLPIAEFWQISSFIVPKLHFNFSHQPYLPKGMSVSIEIANSERPFVPGEKVEGTLNINAEHPLKAKSIRIFLRAGAVTEWWVSVYGIDSVHGRSAKVLYAAGVTYAQEEHCLWAPDDKEKKGTIPSGTHSFPFAFTLPADCPPSFEGRFLK